jgi:hypothetical protein
MNSIRHHQAPNLLARLAQQMLAYARGVESVEIVETAPSPTITRRLQTISTIGKLAASGFGKPIDLTSTVRVVAIVTMSPSKGAVKSAISPHPSHALPRPGLARLARIGVATANSSRLVALR